MMSNAQRGKSQCEKPSRVAEEKPTRKKYYLAFHPLCLPGTRAFSFHAFFPLALVVQPGMAFFAVHPGLFNFMLSSPLALVMQPGVAFFFFAIHCAQRV